MTKNWIDDVTQVDRTVRTTCSSSMPLTTASRCHGNQVSTAAYLSVSRCTTVKSAARAWSTKMWCLELPTCTPSEVPLSIRGVLAVRILNECWHNVSSKWVGEDVKFQVVNYRRWMKCRFYFYYLQQGGYVFISLCLFVSRIVQNYSTVIIKKLVEMWQLDQGRND